MHLSNRFLFLDLEDTIITPVVNGWHTTELINLQKIRDFIAGFRPDAISIFSFAIWNKRELGLFNTHCRPMIEQALGTELQMVPTVDDDIIPACCEVMGITRDTVDFSDASAFWGKHQAFRLFCRKTFKNTWVNWDTETAVALLDDAVFSEDFTWNDLHLTGHIRNIDTL